MKLRIATIFTLLVSALQWVVISSFVSHSYMWFLKADAPKIDAGIFMAAVWASVTVVSFGFSCWVYDKLHRQESKFRFAALVSALFGVSGLLVFWGMASVGLIFLVNR